MRLSLSKHFDKKGETVNKNIIGILFDCDGVLVDSEPALAKVAAEVMQKEEGIPAKPEDFFPYIGTGEDTYLGMVMEKYGLTYRPEIKPYVYDLYIEKAAENVKGFPGALDLLKKYKRNGIKMAVASSADYVKVEANLKALGFEDFDAIISGSDVERKKPWPDIYLLAAKNIGLKPQNCVVIEDATAGIKSGNAAGMTTIGFTSACSKAELLDAGADYVVDNYSEMEEVLAKILA